MSRRNFKLSWLFGLALALAAGVTAAQEPQEGRQYHRFKTPQAVETGKKIEVIEFFSYGCPHCANLEPVLSPWTKKLGADVQFRRVPVVFHNSWANLAKIYFTLDTLGVEDKFSPMVFEALHGERVAMHQEAAFLDWAAKKGLDRAKVASVFQSFSVNSALGKARSQAAAYRVQGVPQVIVDGKFMTDPDSAGSNEQLLKIVDYLIAKAKQERGKS